MAVKLIDSWQKILASEFDKQYMKQLKDFLQAEKNSGKIIYPKNQDIFSALNTTPYEDVKVVIIGQDPYHGPHQAHGMCFSVLPGIKPPPSLVNIYKELKADLDIEPVEHGYLLSWAKQGVLLLNSVLTVERSKANSHQGKGWELFTDKIISLLNERDEPIIFVLWGNYAQKKCTHIDHNKHLILQASHPSPFSARTGFFGCKHFSKINEYLLALHKEPIDWKLPSIIELNEQQKVY